ncbi:MAM and LDL-receptor class a domain-containing protein 1-like, partial [Plakobranchus ocellatus]
DLCDFENGDICGYKKARGSWIKRRATYIENLTGLSADRSTRTKWGSYIYVDTQTDNVQKSPELVSPVFPATSGRCLQFFYHVKHPVQGTAALDVYLRDEEKHSYLLGRFSGMDGQSWLMAQAMLISSTPYQIVFDAEYKTSIVSLDDIKITNTMCANAYDCDFEYGLCSWRTDLDDAGNLDWQVKSGYLPEGEKGPHKDVTLNTQYGRYILLQGVDPAKPGDTAVLTSQEMNMGSCLIFYYSMMADGTGSLSVNLTTPGEDSVPQTLWSRSGGQGDFPVWRQARVDIPVKRTLKDSLKDFQLHLIGTVGTRIGADIAVDEISVHYNPCSDGWLNRFLVCSAKRILLCRSPKYNHRE